jgi:hypothetical protein
MTPGALTVFDAYDFTCNFSLYLTELFLAVGAMKERHKEEGSCAPLSSKHEYFVI